MALQKSTNTHDVYEYLRVPNRTKDLEVVVV